MTFNEMNFNIQWDELLELDLENAVEIPKSDFKAEFMIDPSIFDESFSDKPEEVVLLSNSQFESHTENLSNNNNLLNITLFDPNENPASENVTVQGNVEPHESDTVCSIPVSPSESLETTNTASSILPAVQSEDTVSGLPTQAKSGFIHITKDDVKSFNEVNKNKNTKRKLEGNMRKLYAFFELKKEKRNIHEIPMSDLDELLAMFLLSMRKEDGEEYETTTLRSYVSTIDKTLNEKSYPFTISKGDRQGFPLLRETMSAKTKKLKKEGKGNKAHAAQPISDEEINSLYEKGLLGLSTPQSVLNTLWLKFTIHFGMRGVKEHYDLCWGDVKLCYDSEGTEYLELNERQTKTRTGETADTRAVMPKMWATEDNRCPVAAYNFYAAKRPQGFSRNEDPFYIAARTVPVKDISDQWFLRQKVGFKKLSGFLKTMCISAGFEPKRKLTNHSARKHLVQKLRDSDVSPVDIMQISGHKNVQSIINYSNLSLQSQKKCSMLLANKAVANSSDFRQKGSPTPGFSGSNPVTPVTFTATSVTQKENVSVAQSKPKTDEMQPSEQHRAPAWVPTNSNLQYMFFGATLHIENLNFYASPPNTNMN